jgi:uncharacterized Zn finger protein
MSWSGRFAPYVPVAQRLAGAKKYAAAVAKKEHRSVAPVTIEGRKIANSFWGLAWCENLTRYSDYENRLPRGGTYVRNGSVVDLVISEGLIKALVGGSEVYTITIRIGTLAAGKWKQIKRECSQSIDSMLDLMQGKFDRAVMDRLTHKHQGLFPQPNEIKLDCSCPDDAGMCKHIAAVMYGVGHRLDSSPELLFRLRAVDHLELIRDAVSAENLDRAFAVGQDSALAGSDLGELFGIDLEVGFVPSEKQVRPARAARKATLKKPAQLKSPTKKPKPDPLLKSPAASLELSPGNAVRKTSKKKLPLAATKIEEVASPTTSTLLARTLAIIATMKRDRINAANKKVAKAKRAPKAIRAPARIRKST